MANINSKQSPEDEEIIADLQKIRTDFKKNLNNHLTERDERIKKIIKNRDEKELKKVSSSLMS